jgi:PAS domain S-box-containing protein
MNDTQKTKEELLLELEELKQKHNSLSKTIEIGLSEKNEEKRLLEKLINSSEDFIQFSDSTPYDKIIQIILEISGANYAVLNIFDENGLEFTTVAFTGISENIKKVSAFLGFDIINKHWNRDLNREEKTKKHTITRFEHLHDLAGNVLSKNIIQTIEKIFGVQEAFVVKTVKNNLVLGDFTLIFKTGETLKNHPFVELYAHQVGLFLDRNIITNSLRVSEEKHRQLIDNSHDIIYTLTPEGIFMYVSAAWTSLLGHSVSQVIGQSFQQFVHKDDIPKCIDFIEKVITTGQRHEGVEYRVQHSNGKWYWHTSSAVPIKDKAGKVLGFEGTARDITERKLAEKKQIESEEKYRLIFEFSPMGIISFDEKGVITACNENFVKIIGSSREKIIGLNMLELPDKVLVSAITEALNGKPEVYEGDYSSVTAKKTTPIRGLFAPMNGGGSIIGGVGIIEDITQRKNSEGVIQQSSQKWEAIISASPDGIGMASLDGKLLFMSEKLAAIYGYSQEEKDASIGNSIFSFIDVTYHSLLLENIQKLLAGEKHQKITEYLAIKKDNSKFYVDVNSTILYDNKGNPESILFVERDITERKEVEHSLQTKTAILEAQTNATIEAILIIDVNQKRALINQRAIELFEVPPHILEDDDDAQLLEHVVGLTKYPEKFLEKVMYLYDHPNETSFDEIEFKRGTILDRYSAPVMGTNGENLGRIWTFRDITQRKQVEAELKKSEDNFRTFFDSIADLLFVLDTNGNMIDVNETVIRRLEYTKEELIGKSVLIVHPEDRREEAGATVAAMLAGTKDFCPIPVLSKSGKEIQVETRVYPGMWDGEPALYGVVKDITKMKQSEEKFSKAFQSGSNLMAISTNDTGRYIEVNDMFLHIMEFTKDEVIGKTVLELNLFDDINQRDIIKLKMKEKGFVNNVEVKIKSKTGKILIGLFSASYIYIGEDLCLLTSMIDITEKKMHEEKLALILSETENMNRLMTGREERVLELKLEINNLLKQLGKDIKYRSVED